MGMLYDGWLKISERIYKDRPFELLEDQEAVGALVVDIQGKILVVKQFRVPLMRESLEIPAGCLDKEGLTPEEIMAEELEEEANLKVDPSALKLLLTILPNIGISKSRYFLYSWAFPDVGVDSLILEDADVTERLWLSLEEFKEKIDQGEIMDAKSILAYYYLLGNPITQRLE